MRTHPEIRRDFLGLILAAACWGLGTVISKRALDDIPPLVLLPAQLASSLVFLALVMRRNGIRLAGGSTGLGRLGLLNPGLAYALSLVGLTYISASVSVLLWAVEPLLILLLASFALGERVGPQLVVLSLVALGGIVLIIYDPAAGGQWIGVGLTLAGVGCCALYTVIARRWLGGDDSTIHVVFAQQVHAFAFAFGLLAVALLAGLAATATITVGGVASAAGSGILYYGAAYWFYLSGLRSVPASIAASSFYLVPVFGVAFAFVLLGDQLDVRQWAGIAVAVGAVLAIIRRTTSRGGPDAPIASAVDLFRDVPGS